MLKFEPKPTTKDELLWVVRTIYVDLFRNKLIQFALKMLFYGSIIMAIYQGVLFLYEFEIHYFVKYSSMYCFTCFILLAAYSVPIIAEVATTAFTTIKCWKIDSGGALVENKIKQEAHFTNIITAINCIFGLMVLVLFIVPFEDDNDFYFLFIAFEKYFPQWQQLLKWGFKAFFPCITILLQAPFYIVIYACLRIKFELYMWMEFLKNLNIVYEKSDICELVHDSEYQTEISKRLRFCIERQEHIYRSLLLYGKKYVQQLDIYIFAYAILGSLGGISIIFVCISFEGNFFQGTYLRLSALTFVTLTTFMHVIWAGQSVETTSSDSYDILKQCDWFLWNLKNRKTYLMCLNYTQRPLKAQFTQNVSINYVLGFSVVRTVYSTLTALNSLRKASK
ncbi:odorant receptor 283 [Tribolium castaneum]|uniref:Odorant receptor n=1 Tax=Tribolium castaneum TaxID=7070 RepID=D6WEV7_TRICA|nr:odorant receptor 283 [Tribolium castaneum]